MALRMGAKIFLVEKNKERCIFLRSLFTLRSNNFKCFEIFGNIIEEMAENADLIIGSVLLKDTATPKIITEDMIKKMEKGSVIADISIDEGGCVETSRPTSHKNPVFTKHGIIHYCVPNMPGIVPRTATMKLIKETFRFISLLASKREQCFKTNEALAKGVNAYMGFITHPKPAQVLGENYTPLKELL